MLSVQVYSMKHQLLLQRERFRVQEMKVKVEEEITMKRIVMGLLAMEKKAKATAKTTIKNF